MEVLLKIIEYGGIIITVSVIVGAFCVMLYWVGILLWYLILEDFIEFIKNRFFHRNFDF